MSEFVGRSMTEDDFVLRPDIHLAVWNDEEGLFEPFGRYPFKLFWTVPAVGDVLIIPDDVLGPVRVLARIFVAHSPTANWWWLSCEEVADVSIGKLLALDQEVREVYGELRAEADRRSWDDQAERGRKRGAKFPA